MPQSFSITDIGLRREMNQDYIFASDLPLGNLSCLYLVADGMGGHRAGDYASKYTVETVVDHVAGTEGEDPEELLGEAYRIANTQIRLKAARHREFYGMGTTLVSCGSLPGGGNGQSRHAGQKARKDPSGEKRDHESDRRGRPGQGGLLPGSFIGMRDHPYVLGRPYDHGRG